MTERPGTAAQDDPLDQPGTADRPGPAVQEGMVDVRRRTATVRGVEFGRGRPEIIVPLVGDDLDALLAQAEAASATPAGTPCRWGRSCSWAPSCPRPGSRSRCACCSPPSSRRGSPPGRRARSRRDDERP